MGIYYQGMIPAGDDFFRQAFKQWRRKQADAGTFSVAGFEGFYNPGAFNEPDTLMAKDTPLK